MDSVVGGLGVVGAALIGSGATYLVAKRSKSGRIDTTEAETLWTQAAEMRKELHDEVVECRTQLTKVQRDNNELRTETSKLRSDLADAKMKMADQAMEIADLKASLKDATHELTRALTELTSRSQSTDSDVQAFKRELQMLQGGPG